MFVEVARIFILKNDIRIAYKRKQGCNLFSFYYCLYFPKFTPSSFYFCLVRFMSAVFFKTLVTICLDCSNFKLGIGK